MKRNNKCVKCGGTDLLRMPSIPGEGPHIVVGNYPMHSVPIVNLVCSKCGYIEAWIDSEKDLSKLREEYRQK